MPAGAAAAAAAGGGYSGLEEEEGASQLSPAAAVAGSPPCGSPPYAAADSAERRAPPRVPSASRSAASSEPATLPISSPEAGAQAPSFAHSSAPSAPSAEAVPGGSDLGERASRARSSGGGKLTDSFRRALPGLHTRLHNLSRLGSPRPLAQDPAVEEMAAAAVRGTAAGYLPELIRAGSSGSYFVRDTDGVTVAVYKPKNEEPYGEANPKVAKRLQRALCPFCCFGRSCLVPNTGYLSEASAYIADVAMGLGVVPPTGVVRLAAPTLHYSRLERNLHKGLRRIGRGLPEKVGSMQRFRHGHVAGRDVADRAAALPPLLRAQFRVQFERLCALDYAIRNTDRGLDNWLVRITDAEDGELPLSAMPAGGAAYSAEPAAPPHRRVPVAGLVSIAAIDNGLAFPFKHPDNWRSYPFGWASLSFAEEPFTAALRDELLPRLDSAEWVEGLVSDLRRVWSTDAGYREAVFQRQAAVLRGQLHNLGESLRSGESPAQLACRQLRVIDRPRRGDGSLRRTLRHRIVHAKPCFSCC